MHPIHVLIKPASGLCNLNCTYCFYRDEMRNRETENFGIMSEDTLECTVKRVLTEAEGSVTFAFQGGEPTLAGLPFFKRLIEFERKYNTRGLKVENCLQTNGFGLGQEWASFLSENGFLVGISLDGNRASHDACRVTEGSGRPTFDSVLRTINLFRAEGVEFNVLTVVNDVTAPKIDRIYSFYKKNGLRYLQFIACLDPLPPSEKHNLSPENYGNFLCRLFDLWYDDLLTGQQPYIREFENWVGIASGYGSEACDQRGVCSVQYVIEADGSVYPCDFYCLDEYRMGNIRENSFAELEKNAAAARFVEESRTGRMNCVSCRYRLLCRGGCRRCCIAGSDLSRVGENQFCSAYRMFFDRNFETILRIAQRVSEK